MESKRKTGKEQTGHHLWHWRVKKAWAEPLMFTYKQFTFSCDHASEKVIKKEIEHYPSYVVDQHNQM